MFQLAGKEFVSLRSQIATANLAKRRNPPYAFTEHGAVMPADVPNSDAAIHASIQVVKTFVKLRRMFEAHEELAWKLDALEKKYDSRFQAVFQAIRRLMEPPMENKGRIGFRKEGNREGTKK